MALENGKYEITGYGEYNVGRLENLTEDLGPKPVCTRAVNAEYKRWRVRRSRDGKYDLVNVHPSANVGNWLFVVLDPLQRGTKWVVTAVNAEPKLYQIKDPDTDRVWTVPPRDHLGSVQITLKDVSEDISERQRFAFIPMPED